LYGFLIKLEKADNVVKTMIDHMSDVQSGATYKLSLKQGQFTLDIAVNYIVNGLKISTENVVVYNYI